MPETLSYDDLPAGSDLAREFTAEGGVVITASVAEPSARAARWARRRAAPWAAIDTALILAGMVLALYPLFARWTALRYLPGAVYPLAGVLAAAVFLLTWHARAGRYLDALRAARRHATVIAADTKALRVESDGPTGAQSEVIAAALVERIERAGSWRRGWLAIDRNVLRITLHDGRTLDLLPGRDDSELEWAVRSLRRALGVGE